MSRGTMCLARSAVVLFTVSTFARLTSAAPVSDQSSPAAMASFNATGSLISWQQEVTAGMAGTLSRIEIYADNAGTAGLTINRGNFWQTDASDFTTSLVASGQGWISIDTSAAGITLDAGDPFVIGVTGTEGGLWLRGSHSQPDGGYAAGGLWLNQGLYGDGEWDLAFRTYMQPEAPVAAWEATLLPAPGALLLGGLGTALIGWVRRRQMSK